MSIYIRKVYQSSELTHCKPNPKYLVGPKYLASPASKRLTIALKGWFRIRNLGRMKDLPFQDQNLVALQGSEIVKLKVWCSCQKLMSFPNKALFEVKVSECNLASELIFTIYLTPFWFKRLLGRQSTKNKNRRF